MTNPIKAFVVDDDDIYQYLAKKELEKVDAQILVHGYSDGRKALDEIEANQSNTDQLPDVIFLDLNMPILNGWSFVESLQNLNIEKRILIYVISSSFDRRDIEKSREYPMIKDYLVKPFKRTQIEQIISELKAD